MQKQTPPSWLIFRPISSLGQFYILHELHIIYKFYMSHDLLNHFISTLNLLGLCLVNLRYFMTISDNFYILTSGNEI
jgi:hypothetical protein